MRAEALRRAVEEGSLPATALLSDDEDDDAEDAQAGLSVPRGTAPEDDDDFDLEQYENEDAEEIEEIVSKDSQRITHSA